MYMETEINHSNNKAKSLRKFDVMMDDKFICEISIKYCPLFPIEENEITTEILRKRPTLRNKIKKVRVYPSF